MSALLSDASRKQQQAANPRASVWVEASAGTGKTKVLADRVLSLLLQGTPPSRLLCLTFTKAAAAEMRNRITKLLGAWSIPGEEARLAAEIETITGDEPDAAMLRRARRLFADVLDAPGGLKIQTIHAFCQSLLARFPIEADLSPHFAVMDEASAAELLNEAIERVLARARTDDSVLAQALATLSDLTHEEGFRSLLKSLVGERGRLAALLEAEHSLDAVVARIARRLDLPPDATPQGVIAAASSLSQALEGELRRALQALEASQATTDRKAADSIRRLLETSDRAALFEEYTAIFCKQDGERRARFITKACADAAPDVADLLERECVRVMAVLERRRAAGVLVASAALARLGSAVLDSYSAAKSARMRLDYDDLILKTRALLARDGGCAWVHYKLDGGIDHLLIDEAQDTNPEQWEVVAALASEFFAGEGSVARARTIFAVGDPKQSIFSFQGADPEAFIAMRLHFQDRANAAMQRFLPVDLHHSFRSVDAVLRAVDTVFARTPASDGVTDTGPVSHLLSRRGHGGLIELWPPAPAPAGDAPEPWTVPVERTVQPSPRSQVAQLIAHTIRAWLRDPGEYLESRGRRIRAGDILVLVRRRDSFVDELVRALKKDMVPVAGIDRMLLAEQLAVMDLMALGHFLLQPEDDLTLAALLKSPLIGLDEEALFDLAYDRPASLWQRLRDRAAEARFRDAHDRLATLLARADYVPPYELFARLLGADGGRRQLLGRLGEEAADPIDEFLNQALIYERSHPPSLQGFLLWLEGGGLEVKRDGDIGERDEVRIMTVHGAKGLQAPIVFLPDTLQTPMRRGRPMWQEERGIAVGPLWSPRKSSDDRVTARLRAALEHGEDREHRRLLYVAMTRAEDRLYVTGWQGSRPPPADCWYNLIADGLKPIAAAAPFDFADRDLPGWRGPGLRLITPQTAPVAAATERQPVTTAVSDAPGWVAAAPPEPSPPRPLAPSRPDEEPPVRSPLGSDEGWGFRRGRLVHRLLQSLPDLPPEQRMAAAQRYLGQSLHALSPAMRDTLLQEVLAILEHAGFAALFAPGSRAEIPLVGRVGELVIAGQIDRLAVTEESVLIVDYKTNRPPPQSQDSVPAVYLRQLAAYRALLQRIYPDRPVRAALLWTDGPRLMPIADALLDRHLPLPVPQTAKA